MNDNPILIFFVAFLSAVIVVLALILILVLIQLRRIRVVKAKQYASFNKMTQKQNIVFLGDSLTEFFPVDEFFHEYNPYNRGIANDTTIGVLERLQSNIIDIEPRKIFLQIGTNDLAIYRIKDPLIVAKRIIEIIEKLKEALPITQLYLISLYPVNIKAKIYSFLFVSKRTNKDINTINDYLKTYCEGNKLPFIDIHQILVDENGKLRKEYTFEGLHINYRGYEKIAKALLPYIDS
jgi:lysophospholipase L1-like esterase